MSQAIEFLSGLAAQLRSQDNEYTASPIYCIQERVLVAGIDTDYTSTVGWFNEGDLADEHMTRVLDRYYRRYGKEPREWTRTGYEWCWHYTGTFYLTREAADAYVGDSRSHRVYVDSACRNSELREVRRLLSGPLLSCVQALEQANRFITNGIELGFIRMPDDDCPDPAHATPGAVRNALSSLMTTKEPHS